MAACASTFALVVSEEGHVYGFGLNINNELGTNDLTNHRIPTRIHGLPAPARQVACGREHSGIVTDEGDLFMCGLNLYGRLGIYNLRSADVFTVVPRETFGGDAVRMVACGGMFTVVLSEGGVVYTFGYGGWGQIGHGQEVYAQEVPRPLPASDFHHEQIVMVTTGFAHVIALSNVGHLYAWGHGSRGQLGLGGLQHVSVPSQINPNFFNHGGDRVVFVTAKMFHTAAVTARGLLYTWGSGAGGKLGHNTHENQMHPRRVHHAFDFSPVVMAACGDEHTMALTRDGGLYACGRGLSRMLGLSVLSTSVFQRVEVTEFGGKKVTFVAAGDQLSLVVTEDGGLWSGGSPVEALGRGDDTDPSRPGRVAVVTEGGLDNVKIGRFQMLPSENLLALAMGTNKRLGAESRVYGLSDELVKTIAGLTLSQPPLPADQDDPMRILLGGSTFPRNAD